MSLTPDIASAHPIAIDLEAFACGERAEGIEVHLRTCALCRSFVDRAAALACGFPETKIRRLVRSEPTLTPGRVRGALLDPFGGRLSARTSRALALASASGPLLAAAAILLWMGVSKPPLPLLPTAGNGKPTHQEVAARDPETEDTFKGGLSVAVIRERDGMQTRFTDVVPMREGDRLRLEVAIDRPQSILGAVLGDDGGYVELLQDHAREAGTHFSEHSARVDGKGQNGTVLVGSPEAVYRARVGRDYRGVRTLSLRWEGP